MKMAGCSMQWWRVIVAIAVMCQPLGAMAQREHLLRRAEIDSLVNPQLSTKAIAALGVDSSDHNLGVIDADTPQQVSYRVRNNTSQPIIITELRSSCSCLKITSSPSRIEAGESLEVVAMFNPRGRNGGFMLNIWVYTNLDSQYPTARLTLSGEVRSADTWLHLPKQMGPLRMSRKEVTIATRGRERIAVANTSTMPLRLKAHTTVKGLELNTEPEVIEPGGEAEIVISYQGEPMEHKTMLVVEGITGKATERIISVTLKR